MEQRNPDPRFLAGDDVRPLVAKFLLPAMFVLAGILLANAPTARPAGIALCAVIILLGLVQFFVVGLVKPTEECLFYKRFFEWRRIEYGDIVKCGRPIFPLFWGFHYLKLRNFEPPLGKLYFVQYHSARPFSHHELDQEMIEQIRARIARKSVSLQGSPGVENSRLRGSSAQLGIRACAITALSSMLMVLLLRVLLSWPGPNFPPRIVPGQSMISRLVIYFSLFCSRLLDWPFNLMAIVALLAGVGMLRFRGHAMTLSIVLGAILGGTAARWLGAV